MRSHTSHLHWFVAEEQAAYFGASCCCMCEFCSRYFSITLYPTLFLSCHETVHRRSQINGEILSFCSTVAEYFVLPGYEVVSVGNLIPTFRHNVMSPPTRARNLREGNVL